MAMVIKASCITMKISHTLGNARLASDGQVQQRSLVVVVAGARACPTSMACASFWWLAVLLVAPLCKNGAPFAIETLQFAFCAKQASLCRL